MKLVVIASWACVVVGIALVIGVLKFGGVPEQLSPAIRLLGMTGAMVVGVGFLGLGIADDRWARWKR